MNSRRRYKRIVLAMLADESLLAFDLLPKVQHFILRAACLSTLHPSITETSRTALSGVTVPFSRALRVLYPKAAELRLFDVYTTPEAAPQETPETLEQIRAILIDKNLVRVNWRVCDVYWAVIAMQLCIRHPDINGMIGGEFIAIGRSLQNTLDQVHRGAAEFLEMGWHS